MTNKSRWTEDEIKQLMKELPQLKDSRTKEEIWASNFHKRQKRKAFYLIPAITTVMIAVLFILFQLPSKNNPSQSTEQDMASSLEGNENMEDFAPFSAQEIENEFSNKAHDSQVEQHVIYAKPSTQIVTIGFLDSNEEYVVPVSFVGNGEEPATTQIHDILKNFNNQQYGFQQNELEDIQINVTGDNNKKIHLKVSEKDVTLIKNNEEPFKRILQETFRWQNYNEIYLTTNEKHKLKMPVKKLLKKAYFIFRPNLNEKAYLVPSHKTYNTIEEALIAMKTGEESNRLSPAILNQIEIKDIVKEDVKLTIQFQEGSEISNSKSALIMLEAILMTAKEFGFEYVQFEGMNPEKIGYLDLSKPVQVPYSPNPIFIPSSS